jgi:hypothetical protein
MCIISLLRSKYNKYILRREKRKIKKIKQQQQQQQQQQQTTKNKKQKKQKSLRCAVNILPDVFSLVDHEFIWR